MLNPKEIHNIRELVHAAAKTYGGKDYMRYMKNGEIISQSAGARPKAAILAMLD